MGMAVSSTESILQFLVTPDNKIVEASHGESILEAALKSKIPLDHSCGGFGTCGTCRIFVKEGLEQLDDRNEIELEMAADRGFGPQERLACQTLPCAGLVIERPLTQDLTKDE